MGSREYCPKEKFDNAQRLAESFQQLPFAGGPSGSAVRRGDADHLASGRDFPVVLARRLRRCRTVGSTDRYEMRGSSRLNECLTRCSSLPSRGRRSKITNGCPSFALSIRSKARVSRKGSFGKHRRLNTCTAARSRTDGKMQM